MRKQIDVVVIGGGSAGLSAALTLARGNRTVTVIDEGKGRNSPASHMMNFPGRDGTPPDEFKAQIRNDLSKYPHVTFSRGKIEKIEKTENGFVINDELVAKKILLAHGVKDILPEIPGMKELWGKSIFHCPYCHGYEHKDSAMGIIASEPGASHYGALLKGLSSDVILFTNGEVLKERALFDKNGIKIYEDKIVELIRDEFNLKAVKFASGEIIERECLFTRPPQKLSMDLGLHLGCEINEHGLYKIDMFGMTTVDGVYAAGDAVEMRQSVLMACASGLQAGAGINHAILHERFLN